MPGAKFGQIMLITLASIGCTQMLHPKYLDQKDAKFTLKELERDGNGPIYLHLRGFIFHSSLAVEYVNINTQNYRQHVIIGLTPVRKGKDGNFDIRVPLTSERQAVILGDPGVPIWPTQQ